MTAPDWHEAMDRAMEEVVRSAIAELRRHPSAHAARQIAAVLDRVPATTRAAGLADVAEVLAAHGRREEALAMTGQGTAVAQTIADDDALARHREVRRRIGTTGRRPVQGWAALTPAEWRVVGQVAKGFTYAEIAERLSVSRRTVESHVAAAFRKIGVRNRRELVDAFHDRRGPSLSLAVA